ncbi:hypothetical protein ACIBF5_00265 [Micromonospora sp. NPDC050417]|uniref:hypothetical protein n=1 Tax=Micromonospora sp. NPDC050417 TaxID=3364280 RepID=UPI00379477F1
MASTPTVINARRYGYQVAIEVATEQQLLGKCLVQQDEHHQERDGPEHLGGRCVHLDRGPAERHRQEQADRDRYEVRGGTDEQRTPARYAWTSVSALESNGRRFSQVRTVR